METIEHIRFILDKIRPFLMNDGGDVEFIKFEDGIKNSKIPYLTFDEIKLEI